MFVDIILNDDFKMFYKELQKFKSEIGLNKELSILLKKLCLRKLTFRVITVFEPQINKIFLKFRSHKKPEKYPIIYKLAISLLCLSFSNSEIQKMFSHSNITVKSR